MIVSLDMGIRERAGYFSLDHVGKGVLGFLEKPTSDDAGRDPDDPSVAEMREIKRLVPEQGLPAEMDGVEQRIPFQNLPGDPVQHGGRIKNSAGVEDDLRDDLGNLAN